MRPPEWAHALSIGVVECSLPVMSSSCGHLSHSSTGPVLAEYNLTDKERRAITLHGMRTTLATWGQEQEPPFPDKVIDMTLAHKEPDNVTAAYLRSELLPPRRKLLDAWGAFATRI